MSGQSCVVGRGIDGESRHRLRIDGNFEGAGIIPSWTAHKGLSGLTADGRGPKYWALLPIGFGSISITVALCTPRGFATSIFYIPMILCGLTFMRPGTTFVLAAIATATSQAAYLFQSPAPLRPWMGPAHQVMLVTTLWLTALLVFQHRKSLLRLQAARDHAAFLANIVEFTDDAVIGMTVGGVIHSWNSGAENMFGFSASERIGKSIGLLIPEFQAISAGEIEQRLRGHIGQRNVEACCPRKNGLELDVIITASPILDGNGNFIGISEILRDNTENKKMLAQIQQSKSRYQVLVRGLNVGEWDWDIATGALYWSPRFLEILGILEDEFAPNFADYRDRVHPDDRPRATELMDLHLQNRAPYDTELRLRRQNGTYAWVHVTGQSFWDQDGKAVRMVGSIDDISDRKLAEERFEKIVEFSPYPIVVIDGGGEIVLTNRQTENLFGYERAELLTKNVEMLIPERFRAQHPQHRSQYFSSRALQLQESRVMGAGMELFALRADGGEIPVEIGLISIQTATSSYVLCTLIDITLRLAAEAQTHRFQEDLKRQVAERTAQLAASNRELEDFASFASHDLKAPLRGIRSIAGFLEEDLAPHLTVQSRSHMNQLTMRIQRMEKLLDDLLNYARLSDPDNLKTNEMLRGDVLMQEIISLLAPPDSFNVTFTGPFAEIMVRRMPLQQVLMNLLGNAIKHHDKPEGNISVSVQDDATAHCFTVTDDGPGIAKKFQDRAFKMFQTLKPRDQVEGSGMGLAVVRKHVGSVGGTLTLESEENAGCIFRFTWPK